MDPIITSALIGAGASAVGGLSSVFGQSYANKKNIALTREQMAWQERMMDKQNEYNTPAMQMQRFKNAGLNPNLIYGQMSPQASAGVHGVNPASVENPMANADFSYFSSIPSLMLQKQLNDAQIDLLKEQKENEKWKAGISQKEFEDWNDYRFRIYRQMDDAHNSALKDLEVADANINQLNSVADFNWANATKILTENDILEKAKGDILRKYTAEADLSEEEVRNAIKQGEVLAVQKSLTIAMIKTEATKQKVNESQVRLNDEMNLKVKEETARITKITVKELDKMNAETEKLKSETRKINEEAKTEAELRKYKKWQCVGETFRDFSIGVNQLTGAAANVKDVFTPIPTPKINVNKKALGRGYY